MASINGVSIKKLTEFCDHDGLIIYQGNIYIDKKLQGSWSQDFMGGPDMYHFDEEELSKITMNFSRGIPANKVSYHSIYCNPDILLYTLTKLMEDEKEFKKVLRAGYTSLAIVDGKCGSKSLLKSKALIDANMLQRFDSFKGRDDYRIYNSKDDFDIIIDENNPAPKFMYKE